MVDVHNWRYEAIKEIPLWEETVGRIVVPWVL